MTYPTGMATKTKASSSVIMKKTLNLDAWYGRSGGTVQYMADSWGQWKVDNELLIRGIDIKVYLFKKTKQKNLDLRYL